MSRIPRLSDVQQGQLLEIRGHQGSIRRVGPLQLPEYRNQDQEPKLLQAKGVQDTASGMEPSTHQI